MALKDIQSDIVDIVKIKLRAEGPEATATWAKTAKIPLADHDLATLQYQELKATNPFQAAAFASRHPEVHQVTAAADQAAAREAQEAMVNSFTTSLTRGINGPLPDTKDGLTVMVDHVIGGAA